MATPICLPRERLKISRLLKAAGAGLSGPDYSDPDQQPQGYQVVEALLMLRKREKRLVIKTPLGMGICFGDSGGPLFQYNKAKKFTQIGIASTGNSCDY
ncbi:hypothetical protein OSTOST_05178, partial [Ostertagia ostertagi]